MQDLNDVGAGFKFDDEVIAQALENIYRKEFNPKTEIEPNLFRETWRAFNEATNKGFAQAHFNPADAFADEIRYNNAVFSAFRVHRQQNDIASRLLDENGKLKSFSAWKKEVLPIADHYNKTWLKTEYDTAVIRAHRAAEWKQFEAEADVLPNLEWIETTSPNPGADHKIFWGTIKPINDVFWSQHRPGDRWNCKCSLRQTDKEPTTTPNVQDGKDMPADGLENNPANDGKLFSDKHPYRAEAYSGAKKAVEKFIDKEGIGNILERAKRHIVKADIKATREAIRNSGIDPKTGAVFTDSSFASGQMRVLRGSLKSTLAHSIYNDDIRDWVRNFDSSKMQGWKYAGWAKNKPNPKKPTTTKHPEAEFFTYYRVRINKRTYWANVKRHKFYDNEVLYAILDIKPNPLIKGKPPKK